MFADLDKQIAEEIDEEYFFNKIKLVFKRDFARFSI